MGYFYWGFFFESSLSIFSISLPDIVLMNLVFETFIQLGLLNEFVTEPEMTNETLLGPSESERKQNKH